MNNIKYIMLPRIEEKPKDIKPQPWLDFHFSYQSNLFNYNYN